VLWSLRRDVMSLPNSRQSPCFAVHVLAAHQRDISNHFARPAPDKLANVAWQRALEAAPSFRDAWRHSNAA
jgi:flavin reductase (DIM6/NTAB) family NADH-FMN oxidoreductase RutF